MKGMLQAAGAPTEPEEIGISRGRLRASFLQACFIRRRFTVLDLALRTGFLDHCLDRMFAGVGDAG
jgi:glycerol-1-phosphate dehydrogenase [NAD(P)+]